MPNSIKTITLPSITNLSLGTDFNHLYISSGDGWTTITAPNIQYVSEFPTSGLVENSIYVDTDGQSKLWTNATSGWIDLSVELMHELTSNLTSAQIVDGKTIYEEFQKSLKLVEVNEIPVTGENNTFYITSGGQAAANVSGDIINLSYEIVDLISAASLEQVPTNYAVSAFLTEKIQDLPEMLIPVIRETVAITGATMTLDMTGGTQYKLTDPNSYGLETLIINSIANSGYATEAMFTFGQTSAAVNIPANIELIGAVEPTFIPAHSYILNIQNNLMVVSEYLPNNN